MDVLGIYSLAKELLFKLITIINSIAVSVTTPILAVNQNDKRRLGITYCRSIHYLTLVTFPVVMAIIVLSKPLILLLYGEKFIDSAWLIVILTAWTIEVCVHNPVGGLVTATGRTDLSFFYTIIRIVINAVAVFITVNISIQAVAYGQSITSVLIFFVLFYLVIQKITGTSLQSFIKAFSKQGVICLAIGTPLTMIVNHNALALPTNAVLQLVVYGIILLTVFGFAEYTLVRQDLIDVLGIKNHKV